VPHAHAASAGIQWFMEILVLGASGGVGRLVCAELTSRGHQVRTATRAEVRVLHPRMGQFARFAAGVARHDAIAPALGTSTLAGYLDALASLHDRGASSSSAR
jgi:nucleoside-diphosphate-sugar epimerase